MGRESACKKLSSSNITYEAAARPDLRIGTRPQPCFAPPCSPCVSGSRAGIWYPSRGRNGLTPGHDPATSGLFCRLRNPERIIGIFLNRGFTAAYLTNTKIARENRPEVQFQSENKGQNLRNRPEVDRRRQPCPGYKRVRMSRGRGCGPDWAGLGWAGKMFAQSERDHASVPCSRDSK